MNLIRWDPFSEAVQLRSQMNRLFEDGRHLLGHEPMTIRTWAPAVDIEETETEVRVHAELPGIKPEDIKIELDGEVLTIHGERKEEKEEQRKNYVRVEREYGAFQRSFRLSTPVKQDAICATYHDGVLEIALPKAEETQPKQIQVKVEHEEPKEVRHAA